MTLIITGYIEFLEIKNRIAKGNNSREELEEELMSQEEYEEYLENL